MGKDKNLYGTGIYEVPPSFRKFDFTETSVNNPIPVPEVEAGKLLEMLGGHKEQLIFEVEPPKVKIPKAEPVEPAIEPVTDPAEAVDTTETLPEVSTESKDEVEPIHWEDKEYRDKRIFAKDNGYDGSGGYSEPVIDKWFEGFTQKTI